MTSVAKSLLPIQGGQGNFFKRLCPSKRTWFRLSFFAEANPFKGPVPICSGDVMSGIWKGLNSKTRLLILLYSDGEGHYPKEAGKRVGISDVGAANSLAALAQEGYADFKSLGPLKIYTLSDRGKRFVEEQIKILVDPKVLLASFSVAHTGVPTEANQKAQKVQPRMEVMEAPRTRYPARTIHTLPSRRSR